MGETLDAVGGGGLQNSLVGVGVGEVEDGFDSARFGLI